MEAGGSPEVKSSGSAWPTWWNPIFTKSTNISWGWWHTPRIPATWEAEAGESLEPRRGSLQWVEIPSLHSSLVTQQDSNSKKKVSLLMVQRIKAGSWDYWRSNRFECLCVFLTWLQILLWNNNTTENTLKLRQVRNTKAKSKPIYYHVRKPFFTDFIFRAVLI